MPPDLPSPIPSPNDPAPGAPLPDGTQPWVRLAGLADAVPLCDWLQGRQALPVTAARARQSLVESLLARPERGACVVAEGPDALARPLLGCLPVALVPHLGLAGLAALATEWWAETGQDDALLLRACCDLLADWCRAHGVRHLLLAPSLLEPAQAAAAGFTAHADGLWHRNLSPAPKHLG